MSKCCRNVILVLVTLLGAVVNILLEKGCLLPEMARAGLIGGGIAFLGSWIIIFIYRLITSSYIPRIDIRVTMSKDNGETYSANIHSIPQNRDIFLKYEISTGTNFLWRMFPGMFKCFDIIIDEDTFKPCDYSGISGMDGKNYRVNALANRQKVNITLKLPADKNTEKKYTLEIKFEHKVLKVYDKTIVLYTTGSEIGEYSFQQNIVTNYFVCGRNRQLWRAVKKMTNAIKRRRR